MSKFVEWVQRFCLRAIGAIGAIIFLFLTYYSWKYTVRLYGNVFIDNRNNILITGVIFLAVCVGIKLIGGLVERPRKGFMLVAAILVSIVIALTTWIFIDAQNPYAVADQANILWGSTVLAEGQIDAIRESAYFIVYSFQLYLADLYALLFRLFGTTDAFFIFHIHAIITGFSVFAIFGITRELFQSRKAEMISLFCALLFFPLRLFAAFFYGETLGVCASLYAVWFFLKMNRKETQKPYKIIAYGVLTGLFLLLASLVKGDMLIVGIAMCIVQILQVMRDKRWKLLAMFCVSLLICLGGKALHGEILERRIGISQAEGEPLILVVVMGFQDPTKEDMAVGTYNSYNINTFTECGYDVEAASRRAKQDLQDIFREWMQNPGDMVSFMKTKALIQWNEPTYGSISSTSYYNSSEEWIYKIYENGGANWLINCLKQYQAIVYLFLFGGFVMLTKETQDARRYLVGLIVIGGFFFSMIWEAVTRHIYPYAVIAIPFVAGSAADGVERLEIRLRAFIKKLRGTN